MRTRARHTASVLGRRVPRPAGMAASLLVLTVLAALAAPAQAQRLSPVTGESLMKLCTSATPVGCDAYVSGVSDMGELLERSSAEPADHADAQFCIPADVTGKALRATVIAWAQGHTGDAKLPAAMLVVHAFHASYPCRGSAAR